MKAIIITNRDNSNVMELADRPIPTISDNDVLIKVAAAGVNRADIFQRKGNYPAPPGVPADIPGLEVSGTIIEMGKCVSDKKIGEEVCALLAGGGYAEYVSVPAGQCIPIPPNVSLTEAASLPETIFTVWHNVFQRCHLQSGENFLVHGGTSGIGITAIQLAKHFGARVFTTVGSGLKKEFCQSLGVDLVVNYKEDDFATTLEPYGADVILDMIGGDYFVKNIKLLRPEGRLVQINASHGNKVELNIGVVMSKRISITGSTIRSQDIAFKSQLAKDVYTHVWPIIASGNYKIVIDKKFNLAQATDAHQLLESSQHIGKIVLINE